MIPSTDLYRLVLISLRGGSFTGGRTYKPKKEFADRMHAGRPASAIPKPNFGVLRRSVLWCFGGG